MIIKTSTQLPLENLAALPAVKLQVQQNGKPQELTEQKAAGQKLKGRPMLQLAGLRFGRLVVIELADMGKRGKDSRWICKCDCGNTVIRVGSKLPSKLKGLQSCGCGDWVKHGHSRGSNNWYPEYVSWNAMTQRCSSPKNNRFYLYGARGIKVCERWKDFRNFFTDMGPKPTRDHSIDRINNDGDYEPTNCRWATRKGWIKPISPAETRSSVNVEAGEATAGETLPAVESL